MDSVTYTNGDNWLGSYYELCLELGPTGDDVRLRKALSTLWSQPCLRGPWRDRSHVGRSTEDPHRGDVLDPLYGLIAMDAQVELGCVSHVVREDDGSDWLDLCIPTGMLELVFPVRYPINSETNLWTRSLDRFLCSVGAAVFAEVRFELGIVGEEASGMVSYRTLSSEDMERNVLLLPLDRWSHIAVPHARVVPGLACVGSSVGG